DSHHPPRAHFCAGGGAAHAAIAPGEDRARLGARGRSGRFSPAFSRLGGATFPVALVDLPSCAADVWLEVLGFYLRRCGARWSDRGILAATWIRRYSGLWAHRNDFD